MVNSHNQDGAGYAKAEASTVNYQPSENGEGFADNKQYEYCPTPLEGNTQQIPFEKTQNFKQAGELYRSFSEADQTHLINAFSGDLKTVKNPKIRMVIASFLYKADPEYGQRVAEKVDVQLSAIKQMVESYKE